jgi:hypothetical protein
VLSGSAGPRSGLSHLCALTPQARHAISHQRTTLALLDCASLSVLAMAESSDLSTTSFDHRADQQAGAGSARPGAGTGKARVKRRTTQLVTVTRLPLAAVTPHLRRHYSGSDDYQIAAAHPVRYLSRLLLPTRSPRTGELRTPFPEISARWWRSAYRQRTSRKCSCAPIERHLL